MTDAKLKSLAERIERLMNERDGIASDISDIYTEAKSAGYVPKVLRKAIARKRMDPSKRDEEDTILELYEGALDPKTRKALKMAAEGATARQIEAATGIDQATVARAVSLKKGRETSSVSRGKENETRHDPSTGEIIEPQQTAGREPSPGESAGTTYRPDGPGSTLANSCTAGPEQGAAGSSRPPDGAPHADRQEPPAMPAPAVGVSAGTIHEPRSPAADTSDLDNDGQIAEPAVPTRKDGKAGERGTAASLQNPQTAIAKVPVGDEPANAGGSHEPGLTPEPEVARTAPPAADLCAALEPEDIWDKVGPLPAALVRVPA